MSAMPRCCETGRPIALDAGTGRTVCSCQLQRGVPSYLSRVPTLPETVYGTGNSMYSQSNILTAMYKMYGHDGHSDSVTMTTGVPHPVIPMSAHATAGHPYGLGYPGFDIHGARRKNATRETTSPLKAWLYTHKKNPYPTKAEKIMLAIVTRMTLTQVSTWFANARRRLKKENRLNGKDDDTLSDISGRDDTVDIDSSSDQLIIPDGDDDVSIKAGNLSDISESSDTIELTQRGDRLGKKCVQKLFSPDGRNELYLERLSSPELSEKEPTTPTTEDEKRPLNLNHHSFKTIDIRDTIKSHAFQGQTHHADFNKLSSMSEKVIKAPSVQGAGSHTVNLPHSQPKPKIWSIAQMIG